MTHRQVVIAETVSLALGSYLDDPAGLAAVLEAAEALGDDPRPPGSFHRGGYHRLRVGRYRVLYEIGEATITIRHIARRPASR